MNTELNPLDSSTSSNGDQIKVTNFTSAHARVREAENGITQERVRELFEYREGDDPSLPLAWWKPHPNAPKPRHRDELKILPRSYRQIEIDGKHYKVHRLVWIWHHGEVPEGMELDHINRDHWDNRIENLRAVPKSLNMRNKVLTQMNGKEQSSQFIGVRWHKQARKWRAMIADYSGRSHHIGLFDSERKAAAAYDWVVLMVFQASGLPDFSATNYSQGLLAVEDVLSIRESDISPAFIRKMESGEVALPTDDMPD